MSLTAFPPETELRQWDWYEALKAIERGVPWLARHTGKAQSTVYAYKYGQKRPPLEWLESAYEAIGQGW